MAQLETIYAIIDILANDATVSGLVGTRFYPIFSVDQKAKLPYIAYEQDEEPINDLSGSNDSHFYDATLTLCSDTDKNVRTLSTAVRKALRNVAGTTVTVGADSVGLEMCNLKSITSDYTVNQNASNQAVFIIQHEYRCYNTVEPS